MKFSVLLLLPDYVAEDYGKDTYLAWVDARGTRDAVRKAQIQASTQHRSEGAEEAKGVDYHPLLVAFGEITDVTPGEYR